jgi:hypothetical protein
MLPARPWDSRGGGPSTAHRWRTLQGVCRLRRRAARADDRDAGSAGARGAPADRGREDRATVLAEFESQRTREMGNRAAAHANYRDAITWVLRGQIDRGLDPATLTDVRVISRRRRSSSARRPGHALESLDAPQGSGKVPNRTQPADGASGRSRSTDCAIVSSPRTSRSSRRARQRRACAWEGRPRRGGQAILLGAFAGPHVAALFVNAPARIACIAERRLGRGSGGGIGNNGSCRRSAACRRGPLLDADVTAGAHRQPDPGPGLGGGRRALSAHLIKDGKQAEITYPRGRSRTAGS